MARTFRIVLAIPMFGTYPARGPRLAADGEDRSSGGELLLSAIDCYAAARRPAARTRSSRSRRPKPVSRRVPLDIRLGASSARE